jgi:hypothetical protein
MVDIDDEPLFSLSEADLALLNSEKLMLNFVAGAIVTDEIRKECEAELVTAKKNGYKISKNSA